MSGADLTDTASGTPVMRVTRGTPNDEELVAVLVAVSSLTAPAEAAPPPQPSPWADRAAAIRELPRPGPGAWVASARPR